MKKRPTLWHRILWYVYGRRKAKRVFSYIMDTYGFEFYLCFLEYLIWKGRGTQGTVGPQRA